MTDAFSANRNLLFTIAYEVLGSAADADDVLQDTFVRWSRVDPDTVQHPRAYLVQAVTRQALNQLRAAKSRREDYVGSWLPEPVVTAPDISDDAVLAESVSMAMLVVLEALSPDERAVFVLHDVFGFTHAEVAEAVGRSDVNVRQIAHRAREHVHARRRRFDADSVAARRVVSRFLHAAATGDVQSLMDVLAPDVVHTSDGGSVVRAARRPVRGRDRVAHYVTTVARRLPVGAEAELTAINGLPAVRVVANGAIDSVVVFEVADDLVAGIYVVRNPAKLGGVGDVRRLARRGAP